LTRKGKNKPLGELTRRKRGASACVGDIGTHAENLARYITGLEIEELRADFNTYVAGRRLEDDADLLLRYRGGTRGALHASQVAPEKSQAFGQRAKQAMSELVFGKDVTLQFHTVDRYGRIVAMVFVDRKDVGLELIKKGLAWAYSKYLPEASLEIQQSYTAAESAARAVRIGLWSDGNEPVPPWEWRKTEREHRALAQP
jgi:predicted dehydrogenase